MRGSPKRLAEPARVQFPSGLFAVERGHLSRVVAVTELAAAEHSP
jgi:hypothetical protein